jgi:hypothetical protein
VAIVSGRRSVRPDGGVYRHMRRQRLGRPRIGGGRRRGAQRAFTTLFVLLLLASAAYAAWRFRLSH